MSLPAHAVAFERLTPREREVLAMTAEGLTAKEVAARLRISRKTVEQHRGRILIKLGVPNQAAAVGLMARSGVSIP